MMSISKDYTYVLFDLDGTLTDSGPGIMNGFEYALGKMGSPVTDRESLRRFVGPPLGVSWEETLGFPPEEAQKGIAFYKEYYKGGDLVRYEDSAGFGGFISAAAMKGRDDMLVTVTGNSERILLISLFDNLGKGASGAAIQNMNIVMGVPETTGLVL